MQEINKVQGPFTRIRYEPINLNSSDQVKNYLLSIGWKPTTWNYQKDERGFFVKDARGNRVKTSPKLTEDSFDSIKDDTGKLVARRAIIVHRRRTIENYDDPENKGILSCIRDDGRCPAEGITCATPTARTTHRRACCNIPKAKAKIPYGIEMRSLFCVKPPYVMLGADLDGIEARTNASLCWKYDDGAYWDLLLTYGDPHNFNAKLINRDRDTAKSFLYAIMFGAQAPKLASIIGCSVKEAEVYIKNFWDGNRGTYELLEYLKKYHKKYGFIEGLDGRKLKARAEYKLLNLLIQSSAAIIFKRWGVITNRRFREEGIDCSQIIAYHDEFDYRCHPDCVKEATAIIEESALDAGKYYGLNVPITTTVKVGMNWSEIH